MWPHLVSWRGWSRLPALQSTPTSKSPSWVCRVSELTVCRSASFWRARVVWITTNWRTIHPYVPTGYIYMHNSSLVSGRFKTTESFSVPLNRSGNKANLRVTCLMHVTPLISTRIKTLWSGDTLLPQTRCTYNSNYMRTPIHWCTLTPLATCRSLIKNPWSEHILFASNSVVVWNTARTPLRYVAHMLYTCVILFVGISSLGSFS